RRRLEVAIAEVDVRAAVEEPAGRGGGALVRENMERRHAEPVRVVGLHAVVEEQLSDLVTRLGVTKAVHQWRIPAGPAPGDRGISALVHEQPNELPMTVMHGLVEPRLGEAGLGSDHLQRARYVALAAALEHLVFQ